MSSPRTITILDIIREGIAAPRPRKMNNLLSLLWDLDDNIKLSDKKDKLLRKLVDDFKEKKISDDEFQEQTINILQDYRSPVSSPRRPKRGSDILREKYRNEPDFSNIEPINVKASREMEKAMEAHRSGTPSGLSRLFTPSPDSGSTPSPPTIIDSRPIESNTGESKGEPMKFGDMIPSPLLRPNPRRELGGQSENIQQADFVADAHPMDIGGQEEYMATHPYFVDDRNRRDGSINVGQPKDRGPKTPLLQAGDDDYDPDNCSDCEGGCCGGRKRKTRKRKKRKTRKRKKRKTRKRKKRKKRTKKERKLVRKHRRTNRRRRR